MCSKYNINNTRHLQDYGIENTMNLLGQSRWIGRRHPWVVILDPGVSGDPKVEVEIDRRVYFYRPLEREVVESYRINGVQFVRTIGVFSEDFQVIIFSSNSIIFAFILSGEIPLVWLAFVEPACARWFG